MAAIRSAARTRDSEPQPRPVRLLSYRKDSTCSRRLRSPVKKSRRWPRYCSVTHRFRGIPEPQALACAVSRKFAASSSLGPPRGLEPAAQVIVGLMTQDPSDRKELWNHTLKWRKKTITIFALSVGNPQCVVWGRSIPKDWFDIGEMLSDHRLFPQQCNVVFVRPSADELEVRLWERGVGETASSGTGAAAAVVTAVRLGKSPRKTRVHMPGGTLSVHWKLGGEIVLSGSVELIAQGELALEVKGV